MNKTIILDLYDLKVCTVNNARYKNGNRTVEARNYSDQIHSQLLDYESEILDFREKFNELPDKDKSLSLEIQILVPQGKFRTLKGVISRKSIDVDNYLKLLIDAVMDERYNGRYLKELGLEVHNLNLDDKYITKLYAEKSENPDKDKELWDIRFILEIV